MFEGLTLEERKLIECKRLFDRLFIRVGQSLAATEGISRD